MNGNSSSLPFLSNVAKISSLLRTHTQSPAFSLAFIRTPTFIEVLIGGFCYLQTKDWARYRTCSWTRPARTWETCLYHITIPIPPHATQKHAKTVLHHDPFQTSA